MIEGGCYCGAVRYRVDGKMLWQAQCHCRDCQRIAGADYVSWLGVRAADTHWSGPRHLFQSSKEAERSFCGLCGTPLSYAAERWPDEVHLYAPTLDDPSLYRPAAHVHWQEHLPWLSISDALPKYRALFGSEDMAGDASD